MHGALCPPCAPRGWGGEGRGSIAKEKAAYESCAAGLAAYGGGHGAQRAQRGGAGAALQGAGCGQHLPHRGLGLGRRGGGEADLGHLVHRGEQAVLGLALEIPAEGKASRGEQELIFFFFFSMCTGWVLKENSHREFS